MFLMKLLKLARKNERVIWLQKDISLLANELDNETILMLHLWSFSCKMKEQAMEESVEMGGPSTQLCILLTVLVHCHCATSISHQSIS